MPSHTRDHRLLILLGLAAIPILGVVGYLPIVLAWSDRKQIRDEPLFPHQEFTYITPNAPMRWFSLVYNPLIRFHAQINGWSFHGVSRKLAFPDPEIELPVFTRRKTTEKEP